MVMNRRLNSKGGVTIPQQLRHAAGIMPGAPLDIEDAGDGIIIREHIPSCCICGSVEKVVSFHNFEICAACAATAAAKAEEKSE